MKKRLLIYAIVAFAVAFVGFALGRFTAPVSIKDKLPLVTKSEVEIAAPITEVPPPVKAPERLLVLETPVDEASATGPFEVAGRARGEASISAELKDADGQVLWTGSATLAGSGYQPFSLMATPKDELSGGSYLLSVTRTAGDGKTETVTRDVAVGVSSAVHIKVYFQEMSSDGTDCTVVKGVERLVSSREAVYRAALTELLKGPTKEEKAAGLTTALPDRTTLKSVAADAQGVVTADFSKNLGRDVAGSCRVTAIRAQVEKTLLQFPEARGVIIAVDGQTEGILQP